MTQIKKNLVGLVNQQGGKSRQKRVITDIQNVTRCHGRKSVKTKVFNLVGKESWKRIVNELVDCIINGNKYWTDKGLTNSRSTTFLPKNIENKRPYRDQESSHKQYIIYKQLT